MKKVEKILCPKLGLNYFCHEGATTLSMACHASLDSFKLFFIPLLFFSLQANMHAAFSYERRDPYARLPLESHVSSANDPSTTSITSVNNVNEHVRWFFKS